MVNMNKYFVYKNSQSYNYYLTYLFNIIENVSLFEDKLFSSKFSDNNSSYLYTKIISIYD